MLRPEHNDLFFSVGGHCLWVADWNTCDCDMNATTVPATPRTSQSTPSWWEGCTKKTLLPGTQKHAYVVGPLCSC
jgi:hypothetical protein